ncbi:MAG: glycosyltransferase family 2 protein [Planctomycetaceae bacterium]
MMPVQHTLSVDPDVSIVVPAFRESENIRPLTKRLFAATKSGGWSAELIIVDDNSDDGTTEVCAQLAETYPVRLISRADERGLATAVIRGLNEARGALLVVMDADLSHSPESVPKLLHALNSGDTDFVIGSRYTDGGEVDESWSLARRINSRAATLLARGLTDAKDPMAGFFALRRETLERSRGLNPCGYKIGLELIVRCRCRNVVEVPIRFQDRVLGESKLDLKQQGLYVRHLMRLYAFRFPDVLQFSKFAAVGATGMLVDVLCFVGLLPVTGLAAARALAILIAMTWNYELNRRLTFTESDHSRSVDGYLRFCSACSLGACLSWSMSLALVYAFEAFRRQPAGAAFIGAVAAAFVNYALCRVWVFGRRTTHPATIPLTDLKAVTAREATAGEPPTREAA